MGMPTRKKKTFNLGDRVLFKLENLKGTVCGRVVYNPEFYEIKLDNSKVADIHKDFLVKLRRVKKITRKIADGHDKKWRKSKKRQKCIDILLSKKQKWPSPAHE